LTKLRSRPEQLPLLALLAIGLGLRVALSLILSPAVLNQYDSTTYVTGAESRLSFTISVQHLLRLVTLPLLTAAAILRIDAGTLVPLAVRDGAGRFGGLLANGKGLIQPAASGAK